MIARVLPPAEYGRLSEAAGFPSVTFCRPEDVEIVVVEDQERIVACVAVLRIPHFEGWWIAPDRRGNAGVMRRLLKGALAVATRWTDEWIWACSDSEHVADLLGRMGGRKLPFESFVLPLGVR